MPVPADPALECCDYYVIFGAAVRPDGSPSSTLRARVMAALAAAVGDSAARFLVTGGQGRYGRPEAHVMAVLLAEEGIPSERILVEDRELCAKVGDGVKG